MSQTGFSTVSTQAEIDAIRAQSASTIVMQPGQQSELMHRYEFETLIAGEKGTGKTTASIVWLIRGNLDVPPEQADQTDIFYIHNPTFRAAVVRRNVDDLNDWVENAKRVYGTEGNLLGAKYTSQPREFTWPSGAKIILTHMGDPDSYMRLTGQSLTRLFWDEITFESSEDKYDKVFSSIRSTDKKLRAQILVACNPEGPGLAWVKDRFVRYRDETGRVVPPGEVIKLKQVDPITKKVHYVTRVYLHWVRAQNMIHMEMDPTYSARLASIKNPSLRAAYLYGDWDAAGGKFFEFRRSHREGEPDNAVHVYDAATTAIQPWWPRIIGLDWGYSHYFAAYKLALSPDGRKYVIDELASKGVGSRELGAMLARWCEEDLRGLKSCHCPPVIPVYLSPDAIDQKRDSYGTTADGIRDGILEVLGAGASEIITDEETYAKREFNKLSATQSKIVLRRALNKRVAGWGIMRELMRWDSVWTPDLSKYSDDHARKLASEQGAEAYHQYQMQFMKKPEAVPKLQISSRVRHLPDALEGAVSSEGDLEDVSVAKRGNKDQVQLHDDCLDAIRYACAGTVKHKLVKTPIGVQVELELDDALGLTDEQKFKARPYMTARLEKKAPQGFRIGRGANAGVYLCQ